MKEFRRKRSDERRSVSTANRELSILRTVLNRGRKCTPPKVLTIPYFPMAAETNVRQGFLTDEEYAKLRDALPEYLRPLYVSAYFTGVRLGELLSIEWRQVDWEQGFITLESERTKSGYARAAPILEGDMETWLRWSQENSDGCERVSHHDGIPFREFRRSWQKACKAAEVPTLNFHDLRRTGVPQVVRMRISGHRTDSMERRYKIVDIEDVKSAKQLMRQKKSSKDEKR